jgi:hypothetical protein
MAREDRIEAARKKMRDALAQLKAIKPAYVCKCGEEFMFLIPAICKCGRRTKPPKGCVKFNSAKYQRFARRARQVGVDQAAEDLKKEN